jgi:hypothetical protein
MNIRSDARWALVILFCLFCILLTAEIACRAFWHIKRGVGFFSPQDIIYTYYPEIVPIKQADIHPKDGFFDILLLGGSVLHNKRIKQFLQKEYEAKTGAKIRIHDATRKAHTTLDSYYKYKLLGDKAFDLVLLYHGINDVRLNNCPALLFKQNYSHNPWYDEINAFEEHPEIKFTALPYSLHIIWVRTKRLIGGLALLGLERIGDCSIRQEFTKYGREIKTADSFRKNIENILKIAGRKNERILLMSFAYYVPEDYTLEKFNRGELDYGAHKCAIELWGKPENVIAGISTHNKLLKEIATGHKQSLFVDQQKLIPKSGKYFDDICHLTDEGCRQFVKNILAVTGT